MTNNTEELRDIFEDISDEDTVTETQEDSRGSLTQERASEERLREIIGRMRKDHGFDSSLSDAELATVVERFYDDTTDTAVADELDVSESTVRRYRRVIEAQNEARRVSDRFRSEFEDALLEAGMGEEFTDEMADDGLEEATEGTETNVSF